MTKSDLEMLLSSNYLEETWQLPRYAKIWENIPGTVNQEVKTHQWSEA